MALEFKPYAQPKKSKTSSFLEPINQTIQQAPSLIMQYQQLKRERELGDVEHNLKLSKMKMELGQLKKPGSIWEADPKTGAVSARPVPAAYPPEAEIDERGRLVGVPSGYTGQTAPSGKPPETKETIWVDKDKKKFYDVNRKEIVPQSGKDYNMIMESSDERADVMRENQVLRIQSSFDSQPIVRKSQEAIGAAGDVRALVNSNSPIAAAAIPTYMARASGEVGNLSEPDKAPFGGSRAILERLQQSFQQMADGTLTEDNKRFVTDLTNIMEKRGREKMENFAKGWAKKYSKSLKINERELYDRFIPNFDEGINTDMPSPAAPQGQTGIALEGAKASRLEELRRKAQQGIIQR